MTQPVHAPIHIAAVIASCIAVASIAYCLFCVVTGIVFARTNAAHTHAGKNQLPPISILKPLKGADPDMYRALRSHCTQEYPAYEILFGVSSADDPAVPIVQKLLAESPQQNLKLAICEEQLGANGKVSTLAQLARHARYEILLVNDGDICVAPDYLSTVATELSQPGVGMVTCLYRAVPAPTICSQIEALSISADFAPGVLASRAIERGLKYGLGSTLAFRRNDLDQIGGFEAIVDYLADDYELGKRIAGLGKRVELSHAVVETHVPAYSLHGFVSHQLRWARTIRASRPGGYAGLLLTFTLPWAVAVLLLTRGTGWAWTLMIVALVSRSAMAIVCSRLVLHEKKSALWLLPIRDFAGAALWLAGWIGNRVVWRGAEFLVKGGKLIRLPEG